MSRVAILSSIWVKGHLHAKLKLSSSDAKEHDTTPPLENPALIALKKPLALMSTYFNIIYSLAIGALSQSWSQLLPHFVVRPLKDL